MSFMTTSNQVQDIGHKPFSILHTLTFNITHNSCLSALLSMEQTRFPKNCERDIKKKQVKEIPNIAAYNLHVINHIEMCMESTREKLK